MFCFTQKLKTGYFVRHNCKPLKFVTKPVTQMFPAKLQACKSACSLLNGVIITAYFHSCATTPRSFQITAPNQKVHNDYPLSPQLTSPPFIFTLLVSVSGLHLTALRELHTQNTEPKICKELGTVDGWQRVWQVLLTGFKSQP